MLAVGVTSIAVLCSAMVLMWLVSVRLRDVSIVDSFWGIAFLLVAAIATVLGSGWRRLLVLAMVGLWALRLSGYLWWRHRGHGEDHRYAAMRSKIGARFWWVSLFTVFLLQAALAWLVSLPVQAAATRGTGHPLGIFDGVGAAVWLSGFVIETVADAQLAAFKADPASAGQVMDRGLWRYSRHPNYFGETLVWWGIGLVGLESGAAWALVGPALITLLLLRVSGVTLLESTIGERRPAYASYIERTSAFIPWPPRPPKELS